MSLRLRITLVVVFVVTAAVAVVGQRVYAAAERELVEEVDTEVQSRAAGFGTFVSGPQFREAFTRSALQDLAADGFFERRDSQSFLDQTARDNFSRVVAPDGEAIFNVGTSFSVDLAPTDYPRVGDAPVLSDGSVDGGRARIATIAANDVFVQIARPLGEIDQSLDGLADRIVFISILAIAVAAAAGWFISGGTVAPIRRLTDAAERVPRRVISRSRSTAPVVQRSAVSPGASTRCSRRCRRRDVNNTAWSWMPATNSARRWRASRPISTCCAPSETSRRRRGGDRRRHPCRDRRTWDLVAELVDLATDVRTDEDLAPVELAELAALIVERQARRTERTIELDVRRRAVVEAARRRCPGRSATWSRTPPSSRPTRHRSR